MDQDFNAKILSTMKIENGEVVYLQDEELQGKQGEQGGQGDQGEPPAVTKDRQDSSVSPPTKKEKSYKKETEKQSSQANYEQTEEKSLEVPAYFSKTNTEATEAKQADLPLVFTLGIRVLLAFSLVLGVVYLSVKMVKKRKAKMEEK